MTAQIDPPATFTVLAVCTANRYRSPLTEHLLRTAAAAAGLNWQIRSAGTLARAGEPMDARTADELAARRIAADADWASRRLDAAAVARADLVLAADSRHRAAIALLAPRARPRTFLLLQFARLASAAEVPGGASIESALVPAVIAAQGRGQPPEHGADELADPAQDPAHRLASCAERIDTAVAAIIASARRWTSS